MNTNRLVRLTREIRFYLSADCAPQVAGPVLNSWSGWPSGIAVAPFLSLQCTLQGPIDPRTDYVCNVKHVDAILRQHAISEVWTKISATPSTTTPAILLHEFWRSTTAHIPAGTTLNELRLRVSPYLSFSLNQASLPMIQASQQFEFSAAHRLHNLSLSDAENRTLYGKCNNPHGHGHNYVLEVSLELSPERAQDYSTSPTEQIVKSKVVDRLDHRNLNLEVPPFDRLNPTVENIAVTIWDWLVGDFAPPCRLARVRVYETPKTWADYSGPIDVDGDP